MANYTQLKQSVKNLIKENGQQEITGDIMQSVLLTIIESLGTRAQFAGVATPATNPGSPDGNVFYFAVQQGTYSNFAAIKIEAGDGLTLLVYDGTWKKVPLGTAMQGDIDTLTEDITDLKGHIRYEYSLQKMAALTDKSSSTDIQEALTPTYAPDGSTAVRKPVSGDFLVTGNNTSIVYESTTTRFSFIHGGNKVSITVSANNSSISVKKTPVDTRVYDLDKINALDEDSIPEEIQSAIGGSTPSTGDLLQGSSDSTWVIESTTQRQNTSSFSYPLKGKLRTVTVTGNQGSQSVTVREEDLVPVRYSYEKINALTDGSTDSEIDEAVTPLDGAAARLPLAGDYLVDANGNPAGIVRAASPAPSFVYTVYPFDMTAVSVHGQRGEYTVTVAKLSITEDILQPLSNLGTPQDTSDKNTAFGRIAKLRQDVGEETDEAAADGNAWSRIKNNAFLINRLKVTPATSFLVANEEKVYQSISFIRIYSDEFIKLYPIVLTNNDATYGTRMGFAYYDAGTVKREFYIVDTELLDGGLHRYDFNLKPIFKEITIEIQFVPNSFGEGLIYSNTNPVNYIAINNFDVNTRPINEELEAHSTCINRIWVSINTKFKSFEKNEKEAFKYVKNISIKGYPKETAEIGIYSLILNHSLYKYQFGIRMKVGEEFVSAIKFGLSSFDEPFSLRFNGIDLLIKIDVENVDELKDDDSKILVSEIGEPRLYLSPNCFVDYIFEEEKADVEENLSLIKASVDSNTQAIEDINFQLVGTGGLNMLKNPDADYSEAELKIISAIKNVGFYDVPEGIKEDDIFVRAFAAQTEVTGGSFGQLVYFANKRIYDETNNWNTASILIAPVVPCDYQEHEFDVTVPSGEMAGLRIRVLIDYSVFAGTEFFYGTSINNKIVFNLLRTWNEPLNDRLHKIETDISELQKENTYIMPMQQKNVVFAGSSNVWGDGFLFYSYLKKPIDWLYKSSGKYTAYNDVETTNGEVQTNDVKFMDGKAIKISGVGAEIKFKHKGSELNICQVIERTSDYALIGLYDGDTKVAEFTNHNTTIGSDTEQFSGDGEKIKFNLKRCFTYAHVLKVNGVSKNIILNTQGYGGTFPVGVDCLVIRSLDDNGNVIHTLYFKEAPTAGAVIDVSYNYGETICFVKSTVGETESGENESPYGDGTISYDPTNPANISSGLDFRLINEKSFYKFWFDSDVEREITLKIEGGNNPYFVFNFASSVFHNVMNAGIGGWTAANFNSGSYINRAYWNIADYFSPDVVTIGLTGNDDWANYPRKIKRVYNGITLDELKQFPMLEVGGIEYAAESDTYNVTKNIGIIKEITTRSLKADEIIGSDVAEGDFVRIGTYTGDLRQVQTRRIETVDNVQGQITWAEPLHLNEFICIETIDDLVGQEISIRSIEQYMQQMELLISNIKKMVPKCKICLFNIYYVDMWNRDTAEYTYIQQWIAEKFDGTVYFVDAWKYARDYCENSLHSRDFDFVSDGSDTITFAIDGVGHWEGIEVWVNNKNVYGKDCYPITGWYTTIEDKTGSELNWVGTNNYYPRIYKKRDFAIRWKQNIPVTGTAIKVKLTTRQWSTDYAHPGNGDYIDNSLGRALVYAISKN